jgi:hypothetical protein
MAFNDFIQIELPKRPYMEVDGLPGEIPVRSVNVDRPRELVWVSPNDFATGNPHLVQLDGTVPASSTVTTDSLPLAGYKSVKWIVNAEIFSGTGCQFEVSSWISSGTWNTFGKIGPLLGIKAIVESGSGVCSLKIINSGIFNAKVSILRIALIRNP